MGFQGALRVRGWGVHSEQGTFGLREQTREERENARCKESIEQRGAARKDLLLSEPSLCLGGIRKPSLHLSAASASASLGFPFRCAACYRGGGERRAVHPGCLQSQLG